MRLNVSQKIAYGDMVITAFIFSTLIPYVIYSMSFSTVHLVHYLNVTMLILSPLGLASLFYFIDRWECRPIEMLSFYLERRLDPPHDVMAAARIRTLNLPLLHSVSILVRFELITLLDCLYMGTIGGLPLRDNIRLGLYAGLGLCIFPIFSFFLTERFLYPVRQILAEKTRTVHIDESKIIQINTRTRVLSILLASVIAPVLALGALVYHRVGKELLVRIPDQIQPIMSQLSGVILFVTFIALILSAGIGILLATSISNPLGHMVKIIRDLEKGNLRVQSNLLSNDEIGVLAESFDKMALQLEKNRTELEDLNRNLEFRVAEKTDNLTRAYERLQLSNRNLAVANRELEEVNKKLKEIDKVKSDFISIVSHELRTPLTSIKAFTELIQMKPKMAPEKRDKLLGIINSETDRLARLITDILDLTKIEAGKLSWHITRVSLNDIVQTSVASLQSLADNKSLQVKANIPDSLPLLFGDRDRLIQVITNILSNAIKFTPQRGRITVAARMENESAPRVVVSVTDSGIGIPPGDLELIFEKFRRSGDILTNNNQGTGLGLAITRQIVEYHGGTIWAESALGQGSTFTFTLPLTKEWHTEGEQQSLVASL